MQAYCDRQGLQISLVRFRFDGNPVKETDTPEGRSFNKFLNILGFLLLSVGDSSMYIKIIFSL